MDYHYQKKRIHHVATNRIGLHLTSGYSWFCFLLLMMVPLPSQKYTQNATKEMLYILKRAVQIKIFSPKHLLIGDDTRNEVRNHFWTRFGTGGA